MFVGDCRNVKATDKLYRESRQVKDAVKVSTKIHKALRLGSQLNGNRFIDLISDSHMCFLLSFYDDRIEWKLRGPMSWQPVVVSSGLAASQSMFIRGV